MIPRILASLTIAMLVLTLATAGAKTPPTSTPSAGPPEGGEFRAEPRVSTPAGQIAFESVTGCPPAEEGLNLQVSVALNAGTEGFATDVSVDELGRWSGEARFEGLPVGPALLRAECQTLDGVTHRYPALAIMIVSARPPSSVSGTPTLTG